MHLHPGLHPCQPSTNLLASRGGRFLNGDIKYSGQTKPKDLVPDAASLTQAALGQLLFYNVSCGTRYGLVLSDKGLNLIQFTSSEDSEFLSDAISDAMSQGDPQTPLVETAQGKRPNSSNSSDASPVLSIGVKGLRLIVIVRMNLRIRPVVRIGVRVVI